MANKRLGGKLFLKKNGKQLQAKGNFTVNPGADKREPVVGSDTGLHGFKHTPQPATLEGAISNDPGLDIEAFLNFEDATITIEFNSGDVFVLYEASYTGDGNITTEEEEIEFMAAGSRGKFVSSN